MSLKIIIEKGGIDELKKYIENTPYFNDNEHSIYLQTAVRWGHKEIVEVLLPYSNPFAMNNNSFHLAMVDGHDEIFDMLIKSVKKNDQKNIISLASHALTYGKSRPLQKLLPMLSEHSLKNNNFVLAADKIDVLKSVIPYAKKKDINEKLFMILFNNTQPLNNFIDLLIEHCDINYMKKEVARFSNVNVDYFNYLLNNMDTKKAMSDEIKEGKAGKTNKTRIF